MAQSVTPIPVYWGGRTDLISGNWLVETSRGSTGTQSREGRSRIGEACTIPLLHHPSSQSAKLNVRSWGRTDWPPQEVETHKDLKKSSQKKMEWGPKKKHPDVFNKWILHHSFCLTGQELSPVKAFVPTIVCLAGFHQCQMFLSEARQFPIPQISPQSPCAHSYDGSCTKV